MFTYAGSLSGAAPIKRYFQIGETCYVGQLVMAPDAGVGGEVQILDVAAQDSEDDHRIIGIITGVRNANDAGWSATAGYGDTATYDTTQAAMVANEPKDACEVEVTYIIPGDTLVKGPFYNAAYGTAITELLETSGSADGLTVTHANDTAIDSPDDYTTIYCRTGANRGQRRVVTTTATGSQTLTIPFTNDIAVGDKFVTVNLVLGLAKLAIPASANYIEASDTLTNFYDVFVHELNLEESGKEHAIFTVCSNASAFGGGIGFQGL